MNTLKSFYFQVISFFFPISCFSCGAEWVYCCKSCMKKSLPHPELCPLCHLHSPDYRICSACRRENRIHISLQGIIVGFLFQWVIQRAIIALKYGHMFGVVDDLVDIMYYLFLTHVSLSNVYRNNPNNLMISFVPSHRTRKYLQKWYNQSELLGKWLAMKLWIWFYDAIQKRSWTRRQTGLSRSQRKQNLRWVYMLSTAIPSYVTHLIIVDDVVSTWSTLHELSKEVNTLRPDIQIWWLCLARK